MIGNVALERKWIEMTYDGEMTVTGTDKQTVDGETHVTHNAVLYERQACALSKNTDAKTEQTDTAGEIAATHKIFCAPELAIPPGCRITVKQYGTETGFRYSGKSFVYPTHQELMVQETGRA